MCPHRWDDDDNKSFVREGRALLTLTLTLTLTLLTFDSTAHARLPAGCRCFWRHWCCLSLWRQPGVVASVYGGSLEVLLLLWRQAYLPVLPRMGGVLLLMTAMPLFMGAV